MGTKNYVFEGTYPIIFDFSFLVNEKEFLLSINISPLLILFKPIIHFTKVVLPLPLVPKIQNIYLL